MAGPGQTTKHWVGHGRRFDTIDTVPSKDISVSRVPLYVSIARVSVCTSSDTASEVPMRPRRTGWLRVNRPRPATCRALLQ